MLARHDYIVYLNDDMVCCTGWDTALLRRLDTLDTDLFMLSGTMIEPVDTGNPCVVVGNYGRDADTFDAARLLADVPRLARGDWLGATWPPTLVHRRWWFKLGGYSSELTPGMSSDNDFSMKLWHAGCRIFLGAGDSLVYHFQCKSTGKVKKNDGRRQFLNKWGLSQSTFDKYFLRRGTPAGADWRLPEPELTSALRWDLRRNDLTRRLRPGVPVL